MPGATWKTWKPFFMEESDALIDTWVGRVKAYLAGLPEGIDKVSSQAVKKAVKADRVAQDTWTVITRRIIRNGSKKDFTGNYGTLVNNSNDIGFWELRGRSSVESRPRTSDSKQLR